MSRDDRWMSGNDWAAEHETDPETIGAAFRRDHGYGGCLRLHDIDGVLDRFDTGRMVVHITCETCGEWTALVQINGEQHWFVRGHQ
jgi:hypothetical protein